MYLPPFISESQHLRSTLYNRWCKALVTGQGEAGKELPYLNAHQIFVMRRLKLFNSMNQRPYLPCISKFH